MNVYIDPMILYGILAAGGVLLVLSVFVSGGTKNPTKLTYTNRWTRFFLVLLRLSIGWHFLVAGWDKLNNPNWSSAPYLHAATGPLAKYFRKHADDPFLEQFEVNEQSKQLPEPLRQRWKRWFERFEAEILDPAIEARKKALTNRIEEMTSNREHYVKRYQRDATFWNAAVLGYVVAPYGYGSLLAAASLCPDKLPTFDQRLAQLQAELKSLEKLKERAREVFEEAQKRTLKWMLTPQDVTKPSPYLDRPAKMKAPERVAYYRKLLEKLDRLAGTKAAHVGDGASDEIKAILDEANGIYAGLKADLAEQTARMKADLQKLIPDPSMSRLALPDDPPEPIVFSFGTAAVLSGIDKIIPWAIFIMGCGLILGLFTRLSCLAGAVLLAFFAAAQLPFPGWPTPMRAEGYLYINKTVIEMLALLALATTPSGKWVGLDGWIMAIRSLFSKKRGDRKPSGRR